MKSTFRLLMGLAVGLVPALPAGAGRLADSLGLDSDVVQQEGGYTCVPLPPPPPPAQHSGAEGMPPLPLPAVPLRRTEKKNPPRPPVLIAKIATADKGDWATNPGDTENLLRWMAETLDVHFSSMNLPEDQIPADPREIPVLYRTGHEAFAFSPAVRERLRAYLLGGGTLILDACCGRRAFVESALTEMEQLLPERPPYLLTLDHPVFHSFHDIKPADINCDGCQSDGPRLFNYCASCEIRKCAREKKVSTCAACPEYSCQKLDAFLAQVPEARKVLEELRKGS